MKAYHGSFVVIDEIDLKSLRSWKRLWKRFLCYQYQIFRRNHRTLQKTWQEIREMLTLELKNTCKSTNQQINNK